MCLFAECENKSIGYDKMTNLGKDWITYNTHSYAVPQFRMPSCFLCVSYGNGSRGGGITPVPFVLT